MATNFYFNNFSSTGEQVLLEDLIIESIRIYGEDMWYIPRTINSYDKLYGGDDVSSYDRAVQIEMYIKSIDGFTGDGNFMSKFGLEIRDQVIFSVAQRIFNEEIVPINSQARPNEGDLIYFPLNRKCFQIKFVNKFEMFYQLGALQTWELTCELFEYSNEIFNTGIAEIDIIQTKFTVNILDYSLKDENELMLLDEDDNYLVTEAYNLETINPSADNDTIEYGTTNSRFSEGSDEFIDFTEIDPFSEGAL